MVLLHVTLIQSRFSNHADSVTHQAAKQGARSMGTHADLATTPRGLAINRRARHEPSQFARGHL